MKKFLIIFVILCAISTSVFATAEANLDLSEYTNDDIMALLEQLRTEIVNRGIEKTATLAEGSYTGGTDIPVGSYLITPSNPTDEGYIDFRYPLTEQGTQPIKLFKSWDAGTMETVHITVEEGDFLYVKIPCKLTIYSGISFE